VNVGSRVCAIILSATLVLVSGLQQVQALPHLYYDDMGLINWRTNWPAALQEAQLSGKVILIQITREPCSQTPPMFKRWFSSEKSIVALLKTMNRYCVCFVADYHRLPPDVGKIWATKGYSPDQCPIHIIVTPQKEALSWFTQYVGPDDLIRMIEQGAADKRMRMNQARDKEVQKLNEVLQTALQGKDARKIQSSWLSIQKIPGYGPTKLKSYQLLDAAEESACIKLVEAAKLLREQKSPQAQLALDEAKAFAESLPIAVEIHQTLAALKLYDSAVEAERLAKTTKQKQQAILQYQQVLTKYPETTVGTLAYQKLRAVSVGK
jgi:hypothetical protein